jgi:cytochrome P450
MEESHFQNLLRSLDPLKKADSWIDNVDLMPYLFRLTLDSATEFLIGTSPNSQLRELPEYESLESGGSEVSLENFAAAFDLSQEFLATRVRFQSLYWLVDTRGFRRSCRIVHDFVDHFVRLALQKHRNGQLSMQRSSQKEDEKYVFLEAMTAVTQDPVELRTQLVHVLLAGRDTTAAHASWGENLSILPPCRLWRVY